ncbi:MAG: hypothetical protein OXE97_13000 [Gammaproteobacteria bacterium]|nr:hypothetical protein [Gammaproteobacteria bacterium]MCY4211939.1 hypothetical protein [Gammaproteobacteria bacterium]
MSIIDDDTRLRHMLDAGCEAIEMSKGKSRNDLAMEAASILNHVMTGLDDIKQGRMSEKSILDIADEP